MTMKFIWFSLKEYTLQRKYIPEFNVNMLFTIMFNVSHIEYLIRFIFLSP